MLTTEEITILAILIMGVIGFPLINYFKKDPMEFWSPMTFISVVYIYYTIIGPIQSIINDDVINRGINCRPFILDSWIGATLSFYSILAGYLLKKKLRNKNKLTLRFQLKPERMNKIAIRLFILAIFMFGIYSGFNLWSKIDFLDQTNIGSSGGGGALGSYLMHSINMFIPAVLLAFPAALSNKNRIVFLVLFALAISVFINEAFRWRLVCLIMSCFAFYHMYKNIKLKPLLLAVVIVPFLLLMGAMEIARSYGGGINVNRLENVDNSTLIENSFNETQVFLASGYLINKCEDMYEFTQFDFIINAIAAPIPRKVWNSKPDGGYLLNAISALYPKSFGTGQAFLFYAEYYMAFGWIGIIVFSLILGYWIKIFWLWYLNNRHNYLSLVAICSFNGFLYVLISRGYLSQQFTIFFFIVLPAFFIINYFKKKFKNLHAEITTRA